MKKPSRIPINIKYMLPIVLLTIITISIYTLFIRISTEGIFKQYMEDEIKLIVNDINKTITIHMLTGHGKEFSTYLSSLFHYEIKDIIALGILNPEGKPLYLYSKESSHRIKLPAVQSYLNMVTIKHRKSIEVFYPIYNQAACYRCHGNTSPLLGLLYTRISTNRYSAAFMGLLSNWFMMSVIVVSILIFSIWFITTIVIEKPVEDLVSTLKKASEGNLSARSLIDENDELGFLGRQLNIMLDRLAYKEAESKKQTELQMQRMDKMASLGEISLSLAHEIRNPLAGISGVLQVFKDDFVTDEEKSAIFSEIMAQIARIDKLVGDMLKFSRSPIHDITEVDVNDVLKAVKPLLEPQAVANRVHIQVSAGSGLPLIETERNNLEQVIINLMLNAIQAMPDGGTLGVSTDFIDKYGEPYILIRISDTGKGIPASARDKIFDPFFTTKHNGTGLGLAISLNMIRAIDGSITFESDEGKGTAFFVRIPYRKDTGNKKG